MAINALIAQGVTPLGEGLAQTYDGLQRNALIQQQVQFGQQQQLRQNSLQDRQLSQQDQQQAAQWAYAGAQHLAQVASDPAQFSALADQYAADPRARALGITRDHITPAAVNQIVQQAAMGAGAAPQAPAIHTLKEGESLVSTDRNGLTKPVYNAPEKPEEFTGQPQAMVLNGKPVMAIRGNKGTVRPVEGATPYQAPSQTENKPPVGYRAKPDGSLEFIPGGPADPATAQGAKTLRPVPPTAAQGFVQNKLNIKQLDNAITAVSARPESFGARNYMGDAIRQRTDADGVKARALVADIGSLKIHDRSGAAVTAAEYPRLAPFIPAATDTPEAIVQKLKNFKANLESLQEETSSFYSPETGYRPLPGADASARAPNQGVVDRGPAAGGWKVTQVQ